MEWNRNEDKTAEDVLVEKGDGLRSKVWRECAMGRSADRAAAGAGDEGVVQLTAARERGEASAGARVRRRLTVTRALVDRLGLEAELHGHDGCVNCLEWSRDGSVLASASDDLRVLLWDPFRHKQLHSLHTGHTGNIFSVKFVSASAVATCAADCTVRVRDVCAGGAGEAAQLVCRCHSGRVKRLAAAADNPQLLWSAGEDGLVLQHDLRAAHACSADGARALVDLTSHAGRFAEAKCVASSPARAHHLAVGANDLYARLYDTRMVKPHRLQSSAESGGAGGSGAVAHWDVQRSARAAPGHQVPRAAATYFAPGHLSVCSEASKLATTYLTFSADGNELLVNLGSEQIYLFDVNCALRPVLLESFITEHNNNGVRTEATSSAPTTATAHNNNLPPHIAAIKEAANSRVHAAQYAEAVALYSEGLARCAPGAGAVLHSNRATALLRRAWAGDAYAALRDCYAAIALDPLHLKAHFRLARALVVLRRPREALRCLHYFQNKFPDYATSHAAALLARDIARTDCEQQESEPGDRRELSALEQALRTDARDYSQRFVGHCNTTTDIKEANFFGDEFVAAGSDDGALFVWDRATGNVVRCLRADDSIVNVVQPHPHTCLLATSGIESVVRLWSARPEDGTEEPRRVEQVSQAAAANQLRMRADPFESLLHNMSSATQRAHAAQPACRAS